LTIFSRFDSLLSRLLLAQVGLLACALIIFGGLLVIERNDGHVQLNASFWAKHILAIAQEPPSTSTAPHQPNGDISRHEALPPGFKPRVTLMPNVAYFIEEMARYGVTVNDVRIETTQGQLVIWVHIAVADKPPFWLRSNSLAGRPHWPRRVFYGFGLLCLLVAAVSWHFTRRVTQPLKALSLHMQAHASQGIQPIELLQPMPGRKAPPELIAIETAYRQLSERLQRNERERALLLAGVSHDLRSPLARIRLAAEMLPESPDNALGVASITRNVDLADQLTASFLEFIRTGSVALDQSVDIAAVARDAVNGFARPHHELSLLAPHSLCMSHAHGLLIERLVVNLVDNALKHGGPPVKVTVFEQGDTAILSVSDAGPGFPQGAEASLLEAFARGDASRGVPGFGLGLTISQQIVLRLQGQLSFERVDGQHRVKACLPLRR
jgi:two-component system osmolarity sensor histidine kinase EnvZ